MYDGKSTARFIFHGSSLVAAAKEATTILEAQGSNTTMIVTIGVACCLGCHIFWEC